MVCKLTHHLHNLPQKTEKLSTYWALTPFAFPVIMQCVYLLYGYYILTLIRPPRVSAPGDPGVKRKGGCVLIHQLLAPRGAGRLVLKTRNTLSVMLGDSQ